MITGALTQVPCEVRWDREDNSHLCPRTAGDQEVSSLRATESLHVTVRQAWYESVSPVGTMSTRHQICLIWS